MGEVYRQSASIVVLRPVSVCAPGGECGTVYEVLLLHKPRKRDNWQLPQGGMERGETLEQSALRELKEESGLDSVTIVGKSEEVHQYDFPVSYRKHRPDNVRGQRIQFVFAVANAEARVHVDEKEIDGHVWVLPEDLHRYILRTEYLRLVEKIAREAVGLL